MGGLLAAETTDPELLGGEMPRYPETARANGIEGIVIVEALIDEAGKVFAVDAIESPDSELEAVVLAAVAKWTFKPALEDGHPIMKVVRIPISFSLVDPYGESLLRSSERAVASR